MIDNIGIGSIANNNKKLFSNPIGFDRLAAACLMIDQTLLPESHFSCIWLSDDLCQYTRDDAGSGVRTVAHTLTADQGSRLRVVR